MKFRFDNLAAGLLTKRGKNSSENGNDIKKHIFFETEFSIKFSWGLVEGSFYKLKVFAHCPKRTRETFSIQKFLLKILLWRRKLQVCQPCPEKLARRPKFFSVTVRKRIENLNQFLIMFFVEEFIWTRRIHFWPPHLNRNLTKSWSFFVRCLKKF